MLEILFFNEILLNSIRRKKFWNAYFYPHPMILIKTNKKKISYGSHQLSFSRHVHIFHDLVANPRVLRLLPWEWFFFSLILSRVFWCKVIVQMCTEDFVFREHWWARESVSNSTKRSLRPGNLLEQKDKQKLWLYEDYGHQGKISFFTITNSRRPSSTFFFLIFLLRSV